jgi:flagellar protein FlaJ
MLLQKRKNDSKPESQETVRKIEEELPYFIAIITLMAASGISPFISLKKIILLDLLPTMSIEAKRMVRQIEILGIDPLAVMNKRAARTLSKQYKDFLGGYVSTVQAGGSVVHFLKAKMDSIFDLKSSIAKELVAKLAALVDAYMIIQVVILTMYIVFVVLSATPSLATAILSDPTQSQNLSYVFLALPPLLSGMLMFVSHKMTSSTYIGMEKILKKHLLFAVMAIPSSVVLSLAVPSQYLLLPYLLAGAQLGSLFIPYREYAKIEKMNTVAERVTPNILRNIAESRKTGLSPEKCILHAFRSGEHGIFSSVLNHTANQLQWGISLKTMVDHIKKHVNSWFVLINFRMLVEVIESGGGDADALDTLATSSDKIYNVENVKKSMLKPYVMIAVMITAITGFTTLLVIDSFTGLSQNISIGVQSPSVSADTQNMRQAFAASIVFQAHLVGLFIGKIVSGTFATGLKYSIMLTIVVLVSIAVVDFAPIDIGMMFVPPETSDI